MNIIYHLGYNLFRITFYWKIKLNKGLCIEMLLDKVQTLPHVEEGIRFSAGLELE